MSLTLHNQARFLGDSLALPSLPENSWGKETRCKRARGEGPEMKLEWGVLLEEEPWLISRPREEEAGGGETGVGVAGRKAAQGRLPGQEALEKGTPLSIPQLASLRSLPRGRGPCSGCPGRRRRVEAVGEDLLPAAPEVQKARSPGPHVFRPQFR